MKALLRNPTTLAGAILCLLIAAGAVLAPIVSPFECYSSRHTGVAALVHAGDPGALLPP